MQCYHSTEHKLCAKRLQVSFQKWSESLWNVTKLLFWGTFRFDNPRPPTQRLFIIIINRAQKSWNVLVSFSLIVHFPLLYFSLQNWWRLENNEQRFRKVFFNSEIYFRTSHKSFVRVNLTQDIQGETLQIAVWIFCGCGAHRHFRNRHL